MPRKRKETTDRWNDPFPSRLRELLNEKEISHQALASFLGVARQSVGSYCDGSASPSLENLTKISEYFSVSTDYLLGLNNVRSTDRAIQNACEVTGLSEAAIESLTSFDLELIPHAKKTLNALLESPHFHSLLADLSTYLWAFSYEIREGNEIKSYAISKKNQSLYREFIAPAMIPRLHETLALIKGEVGKEYVWE